MKVKVFLNDTVVDIPAAGKLSTGDEFFYEEELWRVDKAIPSFYETGEGSELILRCSKASNPDTAEKPNPKRDDPDPEEDEVTVLGKSGHGVSDLPNRGKSGRKAAKVSEKDLASYTGSNFDDTVLEWLHQCRVYGIPDPETFKELTPKIYDYYDTLGCCDPCPSPGHQFIQDIYEYIENNFPRFYRKHLSPLDGLLTCMDGTETDVEDFIARLRAAVWKQVTGGEDIRDVRLPSKPRHQGARNLSSLKPAIRLYSSSYWDSDVYDEYSKMLKEHGLLISIEEWNQLKNKDSGEPEGSLRSYSRFKYIQNLLDKYPDFQELADKIGYYDTCGGKKFKYTYENLQLFRHIVWKKLTGEAYVPSVADAIEILRYTIDCACDTESSDDYDSDGIDIDCSRRAMREIDDELEYEDYEDKSPLGKAIHVIVRGKPRKLRKPRRRYDDDDDDDDI